MKESYWAYWLIVLGILVIGVMMLVNSVTTGTTHDYYELKETASAALIDAVDYSYYRLYGDVKISKEKFVENFLRRFSETATTSKSYNISFYDISEVPPKVSVKIASKSNTQVVAETSNTYDLVNKIDLILVGGATGGTSSSSDDDNYCFMVTMSTKLANAFYEYLGGGGQTATDIDDAFPGITTEAKNSLINNKNSLAELKAWAKKGGNVYDQDYYNSFLYAIRKDFSGTAFSRVHSDKIEEILATDAFIEWAYNNGYISKTS